MYKYGCDKKEASKVDKYKTLNTITKKGNVFNEFNKAVKSVRSKNTAMVQLRVRNRCQQDYKRP